jgi:hypothetical protein
MKKNLKLFWNVCATLLFAGVLFFNVSELTGEDRGKGSIAISSVSAWDWDGNEDDECDNVIFDCESLYEEEDVECESTTTQWICIDTPAGQACHEQTSTYTGSKVECNSNGPDFCVEDDNC